jgi:ABC-type transporter Mla subunit MlaD
VEKNSVKAPKENQGPELTEEEKEVAAVVKLLNGIKDKAQGDPEKEKDMLDKASKLVADTKDPELIKGWNEVLGKAAEKNPDLKEMANDLSGQITAKDAARDVVKDLGKSSNVDSKNVDQKVPTLEALAANPSIGNGGRS